MFDVEKLLGYMGNPYVAIPLVAIVSTFFTKALNVFWENKVNDYVWSGISSVGLAFVFVDYTMDYRLIVLQIIGSFSLAALFYRYLGGYFVDRFFVALKSRIEKFFKKEEEKE